MWNHVFEIEKCFLDSLRQRHAAVFAIVRKLNAFSRQIKGDAQRAGPSGLRCAVDTCRYGLGAVRCFSSLSASASVSLPNSSDASTQNLIDPCMNFDHRQNLPGGVKDDPKH